MIAALAIFFSLLAEALAIYVVAEVFAATYEPGTGSVHPGTFIALVLISFGLPRVLEYFDVSPGRGYAATGIVTFVVLYGAMRLEFAGDVAIWDFGWAADFVRDAEGAGEGAAPAVVGTLLMVIAWVRGAWHANSDLELSLITRQLTIPFAVVITMCVIGAWSDRMDLIGRGAVAFFAAAVLSMALSQSALSGATIGGLRSGGVTGTLLGLTAGVTVVCVIVFSIVFGFLGRELGGLVEQTIYYTLLIILTPIAWVFELFFGWLFGNMSIPEGAEMEPAFQAEEGEAGEERSTSERTMMGIWRVFLLVLTVAIIGAAMALVTRFYRRYRRQQGAGPATGSAGSLGEDFRSLFRNPFSRRPAPPPAGHDAIALYRRVLHEADRSGRPRQAYETPDEYAPKLNELFHVQVTDEITEAFDEARYAGRPPDPERIRDLEQRWEDSRRQPP